MEKIAETSEPKSQHDHKIQEIKYSFDHIYLFLFSRVSLVWLTQPNSLFCYLVILNLYDQKVKLEPLQPRLLILVKIMVFMV